MSFFLCSWSFSSLNFKCLVLVSFVAMSSCYCPCACLWWILSLLCLPHNDLRLLICSEQAAKKLWSHFFLGKISVCAWGTFLSVMHVNFRMLIWGHFYWLPHGSQFLSMFWIVELMSQAAAMSTWFTTIFLLHSTMLYT